MTYNLFARYQTEWEEKGLDVEAINRLYQEKKEKDQTGLLSPDARRLIPDEEKQAILFRNSHKTINFTEQKQ